MKEALLHYIWRTRQFDLSQLKTTDGQGLQIQHFGSLNQQAGPDFFNARIYIDQILWAGNVEMHVKASDWDQHRHSKDRAYDNVILHVVYQEDMPIFDHNHQRIPCLELRGRIHSHLLHSYQRLQATKEWIPCANQLSQVSPLSRNLWLERLMVERLESKTVEMAHTLAASKDDWEGIFYRFLCRGFGMRTNVPLFDQLALSLPLPILQRHKHNLLQLEALLFGQAGFLRPQWRDEYPRKLQQEYRLLQSKYQLTPLSAVGWKFSRMRPAGFPTVRIAQLAALLFQSEDLFGKILASANAKEIEHLFEQKPSRYWQTHYRFDRLSVKKSKPMGRSAIQVIIINIIAPMLFLYGRRQADDGYTQQAMQLLESLPRESNGDIQRWKSLGVQADSAFQTQALLQLKRQYCDRHRCLECAIGHQILKDQK
ncbi:MAG: DUF2851 family protein [Bacteroidota bacterium]